MAALLARCSPPAALGALGHHAVAITRVAQVALSCKILSGSSVGQRSILRSIHLLSLHKTRLLNCEAPLSRGNTRLERASAIIAPVPWPVRVVGILQSLFASAQLLTHCQSVAPHTSRPVDQMAPVLQLRCRIYPPPSAIVPKQPSRSRELCTTAHYPLRVELSCVLWLF